MRYGRNKAFTLIELLVVISIIALLLAILMPALGTVKKKAQSVVCRSNLKQLQLAAFLYADDYGNSFFAYGTAVYIEYMAPYIGDVDSARYCKSTKISSRIESAIESSGYVMGSADETWGWRAGIVDPEYGSYTFNGYLYPNLADIGIASDKIVNDSYPKVTQIRKTYATPVFTDGVWVDAWPVDNELTAPSKFEIDMGNQNWQGSTIWRLVTNRHGKTTNVSFADGHVDSINLSDLWTLNWSKDFEKTTEVSIPGIPR
ncbi:MAG: prepilin-type N-terminal cleavage/methylation domain-containing protein [Anaerohalosphaera sp.]|nr:prepilin-type N-terminal cleavage/methylation domain-containing protein [Anaerohalosphaera sp.]